jgi:hypothetical protein
MKLINNLGAQSLLALIQRCPPQENILLSQKRQASHCALPGMHPRG